MRHVTDHPFPGCNESLRIGVLDEPGPGGASRRYVIYVANDEFNEELNAALAEYIDFQSGSVKEAGLNGVTNEALLALIIDRLRCFQGGSFPCRENALALTKCQEAMFWLQHRTRDRLARGVEGTLER